MIRDRNGDVSGSGAARVLNDDALDRPAAFMKLGLCMLCA